MFGALQQCSSEVVSITHKPKLTEMIIPTNQCLSFMLGGNSRFIIENPTTGNKFGYYIKKVPQPQYGNRVWDVFSGRGRIARIEMQIGSNPTLQRSKLISPNLLEYKALRWYMRALLYDTNKLVESGISLSHVGRCCVCGRKLTGRQATLHGVGANCDRRLTELLNAHTVPAHE